MAMFRRISKFHLWGARVAIYLGIIFLIIGIVGSAASKTLGLAPSHWLIMAIAFWVLSIYSVVAGLEEAIKE